MFQIKGPVLAAMVFDEVSQEVLRQADALASFYKTDMYICHVLPEICAVRPLFPYLHMDDALNAADLEASVRKTLRRNIHEVTSREPAKDSIVIEQGTAHSGILRAAEHAGAGMIVIGGKNKQDGTAIWGGIAERVTRHADCPVLVVKPTASAKVLAATDFSNPSLPAVTAAAAEAQRLHTDLAIVHAMDVLPIMLPAGEGVEYPVFPKDVDSYIRVASQRELDECVRRFNAKGGGFLRTGPAAQAILNTAAELPAQLIVLGTHGRTGLGRIALGSVAESVLRAAPCSVLVVRMAQDAGNQ